MKNLCLTLLASTFAGCATVMNGQYATVPVATTPAGADCRVDDSPPQRSPFIAKLYRRQPHTIVCDLPGYESSSKAVTPRLSAWLWGDIIMGGPIGLIFDGFSGGAFKYEIQSADLSLAKK